MRGFQFMGMREELLDVIFYSSIGDDHRGLMAYGGESREESYGLR